jgi:hypothetical protein
LNTSVERTLIWAFVLILAIAGATAVGLAAVLSDSQVDRLGSWFDLHDAAIWTGLVGIAPAIATFLIGQQKGKADGKELGFTAAIAEAPGDQQEALRVRGRALNILR